MITRFPSPTITIPEGLYAFAYFMRLFIIPVTITVILFLGFHKNDRNNAANVASQIV